MKKITILFFLIVIISSCKLPKLLKQEDKAYKIIDWEGGDFYYVTYLWEGGKFDDAIDIIKEFNKIVADRGLNEIAIGRFPTGKEWQLGFIAKKPFKKTEVKGFKISINKIPEGIYASMLAKGYPEYIFIYWKKLEKWLENDNYKIESPVFEIYKEAFNTEVENKNRIGELRYRIK